MIISCGNIFTKDAKVAPAPIKTNKAGKAQQINVDDDAKRLIIAILVDSTDINYISFITTLVAVCPLMRNIFFISSTLIFFVYEYATNTLPAFKSTFTF